MTGGERAERGYAPSVTGPGAGSPRFDWGLGHYERTAAQLAPASAVVVERAAPQASDRVLDLGCGTGNAALLAAARGATVTGVDPAARLLDVALARAIDHGLDITFALGEAAAIPMERGSVDVLLSVFGVIFAPDPLASAAEMARVTAPHGRIVLSAWLPAGAVSEVVRMARETAMAALDVPPMPPPFAWHDQDALSGLMAPHGFSVDIEQHSHVFTAASIDNYLQAEVIDHPRSTASRAMLEARGKTDVQDEIVDRAREILTAANEQPDGFAVTNSYVVAAAQRS
jgi:ubiquinone/menaquinone biosynthesis C-methylase UbiE